MAVKTRRRRSVMRLRALPSTVRGLFSLVAAPKSASPAAAPLPMCALPLRPLPRPHLHEVATEQAASCGSPPLSSPIRTGGNIISRCSSSAIGVELADERRVPRWRHRRRAEGRVARNFSPETASGGDPEASTTSSFTPRRRTRATLFVIVVVVSNGARLDARQPSETSSYCGPRANPYDPGRSTYLRPTRPDRTAPSVDLVQNSRRILFDARLVRPRARRSRKGQVRRAKDGLYVDYRL